ncbi:nitrile hydratase subunit beta [Paraburkholderia sp.]|uniref:nitrile hydratase subunit beta n=1 Tax=Paraburkholderia sp. TaxID=1926495 RepID=UPI0023939FA2|nr:nitrile hydratase subunit beta [Paraburkholderia sp.]MDE1180760.1 nitrile hydratase subunit beta [Paraburkholderia sp.]
MNGPQDLGGLQAFGAVNPDRGDPLFHAEWEKRVLALSLAMGATGKWNIDMSRAARESLPPLKYLGSSYYEIWFEGLKALMIGTGLASEQEILAGVSQTPAAPVPRVLMADQVSAAMLKGSPSNRAEPGTPPRFATGDLVRTRQMNPATHTRLPRYCRDKRGEVIAVHGAHVFPDTNALGHGEQPQWLYTIRFDAHELWGPDTTAASVCVECWEPYLDDIA